MILRLTIGCLFAFSWLLATGCGGVSKNDMMARARARAEMNRKQDELDRSKAAEEPAPAEPVPAAPAPVASVPAQTGAAPVAAPPAAGPVASPAATAQVAAALPAESVEPAPANPNYTPPADPQLALAQAAVNLRVIAKAMVKKMNKEGRVPASAPGNRLSWRVHLLPYLGYEDLFARFNQDEPWNGPTNLPLVAEMPSEYQVPGVVAGKTAFMVTTGTYTLFKQPSERRSLGSTGHRNKTLMLILGDPATPVSWTQPGDWVTELKNPKVGFPRLNGGSPLVAWANGKVTLLKPAAKTKDLLIAFSARDSEVEKPFDLEQVILPAPAAPKRAAVAAATESESELSNGALANGGGVSPASGSGFASSSPLANSYLNAAEAAFAAGNRKHAWQWLQGAMVAGLSPGQWHKDFQWTPALRRPALGLHVGVAANPTSAAGLPKDVGQARRPAADEGLRQDQLRSHLVEVSQPMGRPMLEMLETFAAERLPALFQSSSVPTQRSRRPGDPLANGGVTYLEPSTSLNSLRAEAADAGCDVLVAFELDASPTGRRRSVRVQVYNVRRRGDAMYRGPVVSMRSSTARQDAEDSEQRLKDQRWGLKDFLQDSLRSTEWPVKITPALAERRIAQLAASGTKAPLPVLVEMRYYYNLGLVDSVAYLRGISSLVGDEAAQNLVLGDDRRKRRVLREWMPSDDPAAVIALAEQRRRVDDDD